MHALGQMWGQPLWVGGLGARFRQALLTKVDTLSIVAEIGQIRLL
jgi:hypothetical protein